MHSGEKPINMTRVLDTVMTGKTLLDLRKLASMSEEELAAADLASELARQDIAGRRAYAIERITQTLGKNAAGHLGAVISYDWAADPLSLGSFSAVRPGAGNARRKFAQPLQGRVHFAGDAAPGPFATTVYGAHLSGLGAARQTERELAR